jgi:hypothetical protein
MNDLHDLVAGLTRTEKKHIKIGYQGYTATAPCLLAQLAEAIEYRDDRNGTRSIPGSRAPLDLTALDLWLEISIAVRGWATHLGINQTGYIAQPHESTGLTLPPVGKLLRAVAAEATGRALQDAVDALTRSCRSWTDRIIGLFAPSEGQHAIYGAKCPDCGATTVTTPRDGENIQTPAIVRAPDREKPLVWYICQACTSMRGLPTYDTNDTLEPA